MLPQSKPIEQTEGVDRQDLVGGLAGIEREQDGHEPAYDMRVAVADEAQHWPRFAVGLGGRREPDLTGAALHLVGIRASGFG